jgi:hypothetical protein
MQIRIRNTALKYGKSYVIFGEPAESFFDIFRCLHHRQTARLQRAHTVSWSVNCGPGDPRKCDLIDLCSKWMFLFIYSFSVPFEKFHNRQISWQRWRLPLALRKIGCDCQIFSPSILRPMCYNKSVYVRAFLTWKIMMTQNWTSFWIFYFYTFITTS